MVPRGWSRFAAVYSVVTLLLLVFSIGLSTAQASGFACSVTYGEVTASAAPSAAPEAVHAKTKARRNLTKEELQLSESEKTKIKSILSEEGFGGAVKSDLASTLDVLVSKISSETSDAVEAGDRLAKLGEAILTKALKSRGDAEKRILSFEVVHAIARVEAFKASEFENVATHGAVDGGSKFFPLKAFPKIVDSYVNKTAFYESIPDGDLVEQLDIRNGSVNNFWIIGMKDHDTRHAHYAVGHPRGAMSYFLAAKSKNPLRWALVAAMFEGVDTAQFGFESSLASYFKNARKMDLEEALVYLARAPKSELEKVRDDLNITSSIDEVANTFANWKPSYKTGMHKPGFDPIAEIDEAIVAFSDFLKKPGKKKVGNYVQEPPQGGSSTDDPKIRVSGEDE